MRWTRSPGADASGCSDGYEQAAAAHLLRDTGDLLTAEGRAVVVQELTHLLTDRACNDYGYGGSQDDENELPIYVSDVAAEALIDLGYGRDKDEVLAKARRA